MTRRIEVRNASRSPLVVGTFCVRGRAQLSAARPKGPLSQLNGLLTGKTNGARLTVDEIEESIAQAGSAAGLGEQ